MAWPATVAAVLVSLAVHGLAVYWLDRRDRDGEPLRPGPLTSSIDLSGVDVPRSRAESTQPETTPSPEAEATSAAYGAVGIRSSRAEPAVPERQAIAGAHAPSERLSGAPDDGRTVEAGAPQSPRLATRPPAADRTAGTPPEGERLAGQEAPLPASAIPAATPAGERVTTAVPEDLSERRSAEPPAAAVTVPDMPSPRRLAEATAGAVRVTGAQPPSAVAVQSATAADRGEVVRAVHGEEVAAASVGVADRAVEVPPAPPPIDRRGDIRPDATEAASRAPEVAEQAMATVAGEAPRVGNAPARPDPTVASAGRATALDQVRAAAAPVRMSFADLAEARAVLGDEEFALLTDDAREISLRRADAFKGEVGDVIGQTLASFPCSRLQARFDPDSNVIDVRGHVATQGLAEQVSPLMARVTGGSLAVTSSVQILPSPQCRVMTAYGAMGIPQSSDQLDDPLTVGQEAQAAILDFRVGAVMALEIETPDFPSYIRVDLYSSDGKVLHVVPWRGFGLEPFAPAMALRVGDGTGGGPVLEAAPPVGVDVAVMLATSAPLPDGERPVSEPADTYQKWLARSLDAAGRNDPEFRAEWVYALVETVAAN